MKVLIIDLPEATVREPIQLRAEQTWKVQDLKEELAKVRERKGESWETNSMMMNASFSPSLSVMV